MSGPANIQHGADGNMIHGPDGHLANGCGSGSGCACGSTFPCGNCPDVTPTQFHVTFVGVAIDTSCVSCDGVSFQMSDGSTLDGTYLLTQNGDCAWTIAAMSVPCTGMIFETTDCTGESTPIGFAIQQVRISATQFELQVTDDSNTVLLFNATLDAAMCCAGYTVGNELTTAGCGDVIALASGGTATVTPC